MKLNNYKYNIYVVGIEMFSQTVYGDTLLWLS